MSNVLLPVVINTTLTPIETKIPQVVWILERIVKHSLQLSGFPIRLATTATRVQFVAMAFSHFCSGRNKTSMSPFMVALPEAGTLRLYALMRNAHAHARTQAQRPIHAHMQAQAGVQPQCLRCVLVHPDIVVKPRGDELLCQCPPARHCPQ